MFYMRGLNLFILRGPARISVSVLIIFLWCVSATINMNACRYIGGNLLHSGVCQLYREALALRNPWMVGQNIPGARTILQNGYIYPLDRSLLMRPKSNSSISSISSIPKLSSSGQNIISFPQIPISSVSSVATPLDTQRIEEPTTHKHPQVLQLSNCKENTICRDPEEKKEEQKKESVKQFVINIGSTDKYGQTINDAISKVIVNNNKETGAISSNSNTSNTTTNNTTSNISNTNNNTTSNCIRAIECNTTHSGDNLINSTTVKDIIQTEAKEAQRKIQEEIKKEIQSVLAEEKKKIMEEVTKSTGPDTNTEEYTGTDTKKRYPVSKPVKLKSEKEYNQKTNKRYNQKRRERPRKGRKRHHSREEQNETQVEDEPSSSTEYLSSSSSEIQQEAPREEVQKPQRVQKRYISRPKRKVRYINVSRENIKVIPRKTITVSEPEPEPQIEYTAIPAPAPVPAPIPSYTTITPAQPLYRTSNSNVALNRIEDAIHNLETKIDTPPAPIHAQRYKSLEIIPQEDNEYREYRKPKRAEIYYEPVQKEYVTRKKRGGLIYIPASHLFDS